MKKRLLFQFLLAAFSTFVNAQIPVPAPTDQTLKPKLNPNTDPRNQQMPAPAPAPQRTPSNQGSGRSTGNQGNTRASSPSQKEQAAVTPAQPAATGKGDLVEPASNPATEKQPAESAAAAAKRQLIADGYVVCMTHPEYGKVYCNKGQKKQPTKYFYIDEDGIATPIDQAAVENTAEATQPAATARTTAPAPEMVRVNRWVSPVVGDFVSIPESHATDAQLISWGYKSKIFQFEAYRTPPEGGQVTTVNLWEMGTCKEFILIAEHEISDAKMTEWGYRNKQFAFYAYQTKPASGNFVAVSRWVNTLPAGNACRDFTLSIAENELTDAQLTSFGYTSKIVQFYVPAP